MFLRLQYLNNQKHLYPNLNGTGGNGERRVWSPCCFMYYTHLASCDIFALCMSILESTARPSKLLLWLHTQHLSLFQLIVRCYNHAFCACPHEILWHEYCVWILRWQCMCGCSGILTTLSQPEASIKGCIFKCSSNSAWKLLSSKWSDLTYERIFLRW